MEIQIFVDEKQVTKFAWPYEGAAIKISCIIIITYCLQEMQRKPKPVKFLILS